MSALETGPDIEGLYVAARHAGAGIAVLTLHGEIDAYTVPILRRRIELAVEDGAKWVVVDLEHLRFTDSQGLGALVRGVNLARKAGGGLVLAAVPERVMKSLRITGLVQVLPAYDTVDQALAALAEAKPC